MREFDNIVYFGLFVGSVEEDNLLNQLIIVYVVVGRLNLFLLLVELKEKLNKGYFMGVLEEVFNLIK